MSKAREYVIVVGGLMTKDGKVKPYGTAVTEGVHIDDAEKKVADGYLLSKDDFDEKVEKDNAEIGIKKEEVKDDANNNNNKGNANTSGKTKPLI